MAGILQLVPSVIGKYNMNGTLDGTLPILLLFIKSCANNAYAI